MKYTKVQKDRQVIEVYRELQGISKMIHHQDENACNYGLTQRQDTRVKNLLIRANELAKRIGYKAYHQGDPRGCSLYLVKKGMDDSSYTDGIAIY